MKNPYNGSGTENETVNAYTADNFDIYTTPLDRIYYTMLNPTLKPEIKDALEKLYFELKSHSNHELQERLKQENAYNKLVIFLQEIYLGFYSMSDLDSLSDLSVRLDEFHQQLLNLFALLPTNLPTNYQGHLSSILLEAAIQMKDDQYIKVLLLRMFKTLAPECAKDLQSILSDYSADLFMTVLFEYFLECSYDYPEEGLLSILNEDSEEKLREYADRIFPKALSEGSPALMDSSVFSDEFLEKQFNEKSTYRCAVLPHLLVSNHKNLPDLLQEKDFLSKYLWSKKIKQKTKESIIKKILGCKALNQHLKRQEFYGNTAEEAHKRYSSLDNSLLVEIVNFIRKEKNEEVEVRQTIDMEYKKNEHPYYLEQKNNEVTKKQLKKHLNENLKRIGDCQKELEHLQSKSKDKNRTESQIKEEKRKQDYLEIRKKKLQIEEKKITDKFLMFIELKKFIDQELTQNHLNITREHEHYRALKQYQTDSYVEEICSGRYYKEKDQRLEDYKKIYPETSKNIIKDLYYIELPIKIDDTVKQDIDKKYHRIMHFLKHSDQSLLSMEEYLVDSAFENLLSDFLVDVYNHLITSKTEDPQFARLADDPALKMIFLKHFHEKVQCLLSSFKKLSVTSLFNAAREKSDRYSVKFFLAYKLANPADYPFDDLRVMMQVYDNDLFMESLLDYSPYAGLID